MNQELTVREAKRYGIYSCRRNATLGEAAGRMVSEDISALVITDEGGGLAGVISHTDLLRASQERADWAEQPVTEYMTRDVVTTSETTTVREAADLLLQHGIHRVVVVRHVENRQEPVAVVASSDLIYHLVKDAGLA